MAGLLAALAIGCAPAPRPAADAKGNAGFSGHDDVAYDASHRIESIVMFTDIPKERLK
ncbi:hypothetical protein [Sorangium sp. So ce117]|uniref:hypothetical protein n=1 Tax=Sorangium sp. So ce117 TaxID=3133277 RepID=UPI003F6047C9